MKFSELIDHCVECLKAYNPVYKTIDSHADEFLKDVRIITFIKRFCIFITLVQFKDPYEKVFIK